MEAVGDGLILLRHKRDWLGGGMSVGVVVCVSVSAGVGVWLAVGAGEMFATFVKEGSHILMTANISTPQVLLRFRDTWERATAIWGPGLGLAAAPSEAFMTDFGCEIFLSIARSVPLGKSEQWRAQKKSQLSGVEKL